VLQSMTARERRRPEIVHGERRKRIAKGSGTRVEDVNQVLRTHEQMRKMMKKMSQGGRRRSGFGQPGAGGFPGMPGF
jgi:signal recognition particle subunit SRP54